MEQVREPGALRGKELRAELELAHVRLASTRRKIQELEQALAAKASETRKWTERARRQVRPSVEAAGPVLLGAFLGALLSIGLFAGLGRMPPSSEQPSRPRPIWLHEARKYYP